ncbi:maltose O-acetyltransferase [Rhodococcus fascians]|uniref:sugar O-acetyltransferase n=1 Tax=Nocardiaceae TaxID=85025 RepID=UPI002854A1CD|nr:MULTISPECIES: sugar O-acetyltransferase [Rhodococcus]MDR6910702.1 maltose O-acetyltransferase [Rhodococcus sp. 3258]MDR6931931.1 maltose O-acetyltransferase [Rhodococcus fascians]
MAKDPYAEDGRSNRERMVAGDFYIADDAENAALAQHAARLAVAYHRVEGHDRVAARKILDELVGSLGEGAMVKPPIYVDYGENIHIGARTFINYNLTALDVARITIGQDCQIGPNVQLLTPTHPIDPEPRRNKFESALPIAIGDNVWLGGGVIVCPGVSIGDNSVIGAGSVVTRDVASNVVAAGNPARVLRNVNH